MTARLRIVTLLSVFISILVCARAEAEPWFAVQQGFKCAQCHVNPAGGGMRNTFGQVGPDRAPRATSRYGRTVDRARSAFPAIGGNLRASGSFTDTPHQRSAQLLRSRRDAPLLWKARAIPDRLSLYVDEKIAPGGAINSEAYGRLWTRNHQWYVQAGQMYLPYGIRLAGRHRVHPPGHRRELRYPGSWRTGRFRIH